MKRLLLAPLLLTLSGCATLGQLVALNQVDFSLDGVSDVRLAGVELDRVRSFSDLSLSDAAALTRAVGSGDLTLALNLDVLAENPPDNSADARLVQMDWTFFIENRETVGGTIAEEYLLPRGRGTLVPVGVTLNLLDFYEGSARDLFELASSLAGVGGEPKELTLEAMPVVQTALGPISYPSPIRMSKTVGD